MADEFTDVQMIKPKEPSGSFWYNVSMAFKLLKTLENGVRIGELRTAHGKIETPFFMPVGTVGSVKGVSSEELNNLGAQIILCNTYHLYLRPGEGLIKELGGLHRFINWEKPILTDSGGYQVFSLGKNNLKFKISNLKSNSNDQFSNDKINDKSQGLVKITDEGVEFTSHLDGSKHLFTPEKVIQIQLDLGVDILMPLDICPSGKATYEEVKKATKQTVEWAKRSKLYFDRKIQDTRDKKQENNNSTIQQFNNLRMKRPLLHGIVQGGLHEDLRRWCTEELIKLDFDGYSVGGLAVDNETRSMWKIVKLMGEILPLDKQRYLMGVGTPDDIIRATSLGMDMFDCVLPTRLGRHGSVYTRISNFEFLISNQNPNLKSQNYKLINLLNSKYRTDGGVIDENCNCPACNGGYTKAYISHLIRSGEILGIRLTTLHNLFQYLELMRDLRSNYSQKKD